MPCLSAKYQPGIGPLIQIGIAKPGSFVPGGPPPKLTPIPALIDTGATGTCISGMIASSVGLQPTGKRQMISATQQTQANLYIADVGLFFGQTVLFQPGVQVMEFFAQQGSPYQALVGRDVLCSGILTMSFDGHFTFSL